jgi:hypothetical protein
VGHPPDSIYTYDMKRSIVTAVLLTVGLAAISPAQTKKPADISTVIAAGTVDGSRYTNSYLKLTIDAPNATLALNTVVSPAGVRARLLQVQSKQAEWNDRYTFAVLTDTLTKYPQLLSPAQYVRSVRHQLEKEGLPTVREEFQVTIAGVGFTGAVLQEQVPSGQKYYRGIYTTFRRGYILSFDVEASSEDKLHEVVSRAVRFMN